MACWWLLFFHILSLLTLRPISVENSNLNIEFSFNWKEDDWVVGSVAIYGDVFILALRVLDLIRPLITKSKK